MREVRIVDALNEALYEEMERDERVFHIGEDTCENGGIFSVTKDLYKTFGKKRVRNTPISENGFMTMAVGAAEMGLRPVVEIMYTDFTSVCMDGILNQAAKNRFMLGGQTTIPLVIRTESGAGFGEGSQHSQSLEAFFCHIPGLKTIMPTTPYDAKGLLKSAIRDDNPIMFIETPTLYNRKGEIPDGEFLVPIGVADVKKEGKDITVVATGQENYNALEAAKVLAQDGIDIEVIDPRTVAPLDMETIYKSLEKTGKLLISHVACRDFGVGAEIAARVAEEKFDALKAPIRRVCAKNTPVPYNTTLELYHFPQVADLVKACKEMLGK